MVAEILMVLLASLALLVSIVSAFVSHGSNGIAKAANGKVDATNDIAEKALEEAGRANEVAEDANTLSREAIAINKAQELRMTDKSVIDWGLNWDAKTATLSVEHLGRDDARDVTVMVRSLKFANNHGPVPVVAAGEEFDVPVPEFVEIRKERARQASRMASQSMFMSSQKYNASVLIQWTTPTGKVEWAPPAEIRLT